MKVSANELILRAIAGEYILVPTGASAVKNRRADYQSLIELGRLSPVKPSRRGKR